TRRPQSCHWRGRLHCFVRRHGNCSMHRMYSNSNKCRSYSDLNVARKLWRRFGLVKKQWFTDTIQLRNRCPLRQNTLHLPAAYPRTDLASWILTDPPTFLDHREAVSGIPQMTSFTRVPGHPHRLPVESSPPPISDGSHLG